MLLRKSILLIHGLMLGKQERTLSRTLQMMLHMSMLLSLIHKMVCSLGGLLKEQTCIWLILIECLELIAIPDKHVEIVVACMRSHIEHKPIDTGIQLDITESSMLFSTITIHSVANCSANSKILKSLLGLVVGKAQLHHRETTILLVKLFKIVR